MKKLIYIFILFLSIYSKAQKTYTHIALYGGVAHIGNTTIIDNSLITILKNKIESVQNATGIKLNPSSFDTVIYLEGKHVYPGFINANNVLGLHDAEQVKATLDYAEIGNINPHIRSLIAYNTDNQIVPTIKTNGILYTQATPRGGLISGSSSIMALEGWNWEDAVLLADEGIHINFPQTIETKWSDDGEMSTSVNKKFSDDLNYLYKFFDDAIAYCKEEKPIEKNIRFEAMRGVLENKANLYVHADKAKDILNAIVFKRKYNIKKFVLVGAKDAYKVIKTIKSEKIPVMFNRVNDLPERIDDDVDQVYKTPYLLQKDSILFCLQLQGEMEAMQSRNLPFNAGVAVGYGLSKEEALAAITSNVAKIIGIEKLVGTLEEGKLASLIVSEGDVLDIRTNNIVLAYINGKQVNLTNKQTELYLKYKNKYGIK